jgi:hypothetical protein
LSQGSAIRGPRVPAADQGARVRADWCAISYKNAELIEVFVGGLAVMPAEELVVAAKRVPDARGKPNPDLQ